MDSWFRHSRSKGVTSTPKSGHEREVPIAEPLLVLLEEAGRRAPHALSDALSRAAAAGAWGTVEALARELGARRSAGVVSVTAYRQRRG
jgi:hypothetical protein